MVESSLQLKSSTMVTTPDISATLPLHHQRQSFNNININININPSSSSSTRDLQAASSSSSSSSSSSIQFQAYEHYLRLPALSNLCTSKHFPEWKNESILKPSLQALEITFRLISIVLSDPRPYSDHRQWKLRLESLSSRQIEIIALLSCTNHNVNVNVPIANLTSPDGVIPRQKSSQEVWKLNVNGVNTVVTHTSQASLLPRLSAWDKSQDVATKILFQIESHMHRCPFTLGLGEPNLAGKPSLEYDLVVQPSDLHSLKKSPSSLQALDPSPNYENQTLFTIHQIIESWLCTAQQLLNRIGERIDGQQFEEAASDCWVLERIWMLLTEIEDLHLLMDPDDFLHLKTQLGIRSTTTTSPAGNNGIISISQQPFCFKSRRLISLTNSSKDLKHKVPYILGVEADPNGGPRVQEAAMKLFHSRTRGEGDKCGRIHLLQAFQAIEAAVKRFFFAYRQLVMAVMGSLEASSGNQGFAFAVESSDLLSQMFMDPPYFPSLDAAKTFLGELWQQSQARASTSTSTSSN